MQEGKKENVVLQETLMVLRRYKVYHWRQNTGAFKTENGYFRSSMPGVSDILGVLPDGRFLAVECKREKGGVVSSAQKSFLENIQKNNGVTFVVNNAAEFEKELKKCLDQATSE